MKDILSKLKSVELCLLAHPHNEPNSEFADRITDLIEISEQLKYKEDVIKQMIKKWDKQIALHRRVCDDPLMYTKEERLKNSHYAQAICAVLADLKQVKNLSSNTMLPAVFLDGNGNELKKKDKVIMTLYGLGCGEMDIVEHENELCLYDVTQGYYPLKFAVKRDDMFLERLS